MSIVSIKPRTQQYSMINRNAFPVRLYYPRSEYSYYFCLIFIRKKTTTINYRHKKKMKFVSFICILQEIKEEIESCNLPKKQTNKMRDIGGYLCQ